MRDITIKQLAATKFKPLYFRFLAGEDLEERDLIKLLAISVLLLNQGSPELKRLGYRIVLFYGNMTGNYEALYDVAINTGLLPVSAVIDEANNDSGNNDSFLRNFVGSYIDTFRDHGIVLTEQQDALRDFVADEYRNNIAVIAPTSYGKSELIIKSAKENPKKRVLILVPSKALLAQTKKRLIDADIPGLGKVITHPEMYSDEGNGRVFVLTQERLARLLHDHSSLSFDMVFVDEAHNLLQGDYRNELLATVICMLGARNSKASFKFLTPFLCNELNLRVRYLDMPIKGFKISEYIKSERFYLRDFRDNQDETEFKLYDHFLNDWLIIDRHYENGYDLVIGESLSKNIIYANKPKSIERFSRQLARRVSVVKCALIARACLELENNFDKQYNLIGCLRRGVMYHHGSIPDTIRLYLENLFSKSKALKYLVCSSTLLEGVNLPIERLFLIDNRKGGSKLTSSQLKNLVGRVNRFSEVFSSKGDQALQKLESSVYLVGMDGYTDKRVNLNKYYPETVNVAKKDKDVLSNVLLEATDVSKDKVKFDAATERLENLQDGLVAERECRYVQTQIGKLLLANSVSEINVFQSERQIVDRIERYKTRNGLIDTADQLMVALKRCFIDFVIDHRDNRELLRLNQAPALNFYAMMLDWRLKKLSMRRIIRKFLEYWESRDSREYGDYVYVSKWGDTTFRESVFQYWVRMSAKTLSEKINLAIVRIKEEEDFFDYRIFRFVEILYSVGSIEPSFYKKIKYGTADESLIGLIRDGYSRGLAEILLRKYSELARRTEQGDLIYDNKLIQLMEANEESDLLIFEAKMNIKS
ncbi:DEAD/DEAH box helicase [Pseudomonas frederiksbergensis]|uniref:DEAD/DEAH box helicase n=1 Tax=Pseudomonas frederiksbergensis TaxID=104087 RepID=UPI003D21BB6C